MACEEVRYGGISADRPFRHARPAYDAGIGTERISRCHGPFAGRTERQRLRLCAAYAGSPGGGGGAELLRGLGFAPLRVFRRQGHGYSEVEV